MEQRQLGRSGLEVTVLTFGCWQAGKSGWKDIDDNDSIAAMRAALDAGINFFDTAEAYGEGHSEEILAQALEGRREGIIVTTKLWVANMAHDKAIAACEESLKRLKTDCIDLYQIHWPAGTWGTPVVPIEETMGALAKLQEMGKIRAIGVSNFNGAQIEEALQYGRIDSLQPPYSLFFQPYRLNGTMDVCLKHEIGVIAYSPVAQGLLTGKFNRDNRPTDNRSGNRLFQDPSFEIALDAVEKLKPISAKYGRGTGHLALQWLLSQPGMTSAVVGSRTADQVWDTVKAADFAIEPGDLAAISAIAKPVLASLPADYTNPWK